MVIYHMEQVLSECLTRVKFREEKNMLRCVFIFIRDGALVVAQDRDTTEVPIGRFEDFESVECRDAAEASYILEQGLAVLGRPCINHFPEPFNVLIGFNVLARALVFIPPEFG